MYRVKFEGSKYCFRVFFKEVTLEIVSSVKSNHRLQTLFAITNCHSLINQKLRIMNQRKTLESFFKFRFSHLKHGKSYKKKRFKNGILLNFNHVTVDFLMFTQCLTLVCLFSSFFLAPRDNTLFALDHNINSLHDCLSIIPP